MTIFPNDTKIELRSAQKWSNCYTLHETYNFSKLEEEILVILKEAILVILEGAILVTLEGEILVILKGIEITIKYQGVSSRFNGMFQQ